MNRLTRLMEELVRRRPLLVKAMLVLSSAALLATSKIEDDPDYPLLFELAGPMAQVELTETTPSALVRINVRANTLGAHRIQTTEGALINVAGVVTRTGTFPDDVTQDVSVRISTGPGAAPEVLSVFASFSTTEPLAFTGDCTTFHSTNPCVAEATIELRRTDGGSGGGLLTVDVTHDFEMTASTKLGRERVELPWTVEVTTE